jgi:hypothetical protein
VWPDADVLEQRAARSLSRSPASAEERNPFPAQHHRFGAQASDQRPILAPTHIDHALIRLTAESLLENRMSVMSGGTEQRRQRRRQVFVAFELHATLVSTTKFSL